MTRSAKLFLIVSAAVALIVIVFWNLHTSEIVDVKYRGPVDLKYFSCVNVDRSSFVNRVCYDRSNSYMVIKLNGVYYHYCGIDSDTVAALLKAGSLGKFYNATIRRRFDCRTAHVPVY
jgi:hypothetical protein